MGETIERKEIYRIPSSGNGMSFICNKWVFTGGPGYYKVSQREADGAWLVVRYTSTGVHDGVASPAKGHATEDEAHAYAAKLVSEKE
jgi:hypothetical protein